jgi:hypothetical protein
MDAMDATDIDASTCLERLLFITASFPGAVPITGPRNDLPSSSDCMMVSYSDCSARLCSSSDSDACFQECNTS